MELGIGIIVGVIVIAIVAMISQFRGNKQRREPPPEPSLDETQVPPPTPPDPNAIKRRRNHAELMCKIKFPHTTRTSEHVAFMDTFMEACQYEADNMGTDLDKYGQRLLREWEEHGKIIIATDVDDTILPYKTATQQECDKVINLLKECQAVGAYVILFTCRQDDGIEEALKYAESKGLHIDAANKNPPGVNLAWGHTAKPYANIFLDDRGHLQAACNRLETCMYHMRSKLYGQRLDRPGSTEF